MTAHSGESYNDRTCHLFNRTSKSDHYPVLSVNLHSYTTLSSGGAAVLELDARRTYSGRFLLLRWLVCRVNELT